MFWKQRALAKIWIQHVEFIVRANICDVTGNPYSEKLRKDYLEILFIKFS